LTVINSNEYSFDATPMEPATIEIKARDQMPLLQDQSTLLKQHGAVIWLTGLSGAGKSTLASILDEALRDRGIVSSILDGDQLRKGLCVDLGFSPEDRAENIRRAAEVAKLMASSGIIVICALISPFSKERELARASCLTSHIPFAEIYINAPLSVCEQRDTKGLYKKARAGELTAFTGIDSPYDSPTHPELELRTDLLSIDDCLCQLLDLMTKTMRLV
jgi:adenylyl-sulfate kinase